MRYLLDEVNSQEEEINRIVDSYWTPFWLIDHQWLIRCQWESKYLYHYIDLYTIPYTFDSFDILPSSFDIRTKSTCYFEDDYLSSDLVTTLRHYSPSFNDWALIHVCFDNIQHLHLVLPLIDTFFSDSTN
jgi:hypothetical protein